MSKPILPDELLERVEAGQDVEQVVREMNPVKSRRQAQLKRKAFQSKLNLILVIVLLLLGLLIYAILKW